VPLLLRYFVKPNRRYGDERNATQGCCHKKPLPVTKQAHKHIKKAATLRAAAFSI
jgi:hypothetical protein